MGYKEKEKRTDYCNRSEAVLPSETRIGRTGNPLWISIRILVVYVVLGALWILLSDKALEMLVSDKEAFAVISMVKGWVYVFVTGIIIFFLVHLPLSRLTRTEKDLVKSYEYLVESNKSLSLAYGQLAASGEQIKQQYEQIVENQEKLKDSEELYRLISEAANDAIWQEIDGKVFFSDRWYEITGYSKSEMDSLEDWHQLIHPEDRAKVQDTIEIHKKNRTTHYRCEYRLKTRSEDYKYIYTRGKALFDESGQVYRVAGSHTDISELKEYEQGLENLAFYDQLTGLYNRISLYNHVSKWIEQSKGHNAAVFYIDIDNFKYINDTLGHTYGDIVLENIGKRLVAMEIKNSSVYRVGEDEFVLLLEDFSDIEFIEHMGVKLLKSFRDSLDILGNKTYVTASIGISIYPEHGTTTDELIKNADIAVYKAKETGRNRIVVYKKPMDKAVSERAMIEKQLRTALDNEEFILNYQPQYSLADGRISGFEALLRWNNPVLGAVSPLRFISIAEATHMIVPIGEWVIRNACMYLKKIHGLGYDDLTMSINISMLQLQQDDFVIMIMDMLKSLEVDPRHVELELTESIMMESYHEIAAKLNLLKRRGIRVALDDFGKGYSSLNYLRQLPISTLKIDKSFIDTISRDGRNKTITNLMVDIGKSMGMCVVAEGVETREQLEYLIEHQCDKIQGYLFSKPRSEEEIIELLKSTYV